MFLFLVQTSKERTELEKARRYRIKWISHGTPELYIEFFLHNEPSPHLDSLQTCCGRSTLYCSRTEAATAKVWGGLKNFLNLSRSSLSVLVNTSPSLSSCCCCFRLMAERPLNSVRNLEQFYHSASESKENLNDTLAYN